LAATIDSWGLFPPNWQVVCCERAVRQCRVFIEGNRVPVEKGGSYGYAWLARTIFCFSLPLKKKQLPISNYILCFPYLDKNSQMASDILEVLQQTRPSRHPYSSFIGSIK
jgi:hypothetical protein